jgi:hypothetical protein
LTDKRIVGLFVGLGPTRFANGQHSRLGAIARGKLTDTSIKNAKPAGRLATAVLCQSVQSPPYHTVTITAEADAVRQELVAEILARGDADLTLESFLARTAENAIGLQPSSPSAAIPCGPVLTTI